MAKNVIGEITGILDEILKESEIFLYDIEFIKEGKNHTLRVFIDRDEKGIFIDDCENVSRQLSDKLDDLNLIDTAYSLEVSSPGVYRKLSKPWHFEKVTGKKIELTLYAPKDGRKSFTGILKEYNDNIIIEENGQEITFEKNTVSSAKLHFEF